MTDDQQCQVGFFGELARMPELAGWWIQYVPTPVGMWCFRCQRVISEGDQGFVYPYVDAGGAALAATHLDCHLAGTELAP